MPAAKTELQVVISAQDKASQVLNNLQSKIKNLQPAFKQMALIGGAAFGAITAVIGTSIKAYGESETAMARVNSILKAMGGNMDDARVKILAAANATVKLGFDDEETAESITKMYQRTGDLTKAIELNNLIMDLSRAKQVDLATATNWVNLVLSGSGRLLKQYGIDVKETSDPLEQLAEIQKMVSGQAIAFTQTFTGQSEVLKMQIENLREAIGKPFAEVLTKLLTSLQPIIDKFTEWASTHPETLKWILLIGGAIAGLTMAIGVLGLVLPAIIAGFGLLLSPIGLVVLAIMGLIAVAGLVILKWKEVKAFLIGVWTDIKDNATQIWEGIKTAILSVINPIIDAIDNLWSRIQKVGQSIGGFVSKVGSVLGLKQEGGEIANTGTYLLHRGERIVPAGQPLKPAYAGITVNILGGTYLSEDVAEDIGNKIIEKLKRQLRF